MSSRLGRGRCRAEQAQTDVESIGPESLSSVWARAEGDFELSRPRPILSRAGPGQCRSDRADVESYRPGQYRVVLAQTSRTCTCQFQVVLS